VLFITCIFFLVTEMKLFVKIEFALVCLVLLTVIRPVSAQDCTILSKANNILPDKLCSPVSVNWQVSYTGVNNAGTPVQILYEWDDGATLTVAAVSTGPGSFQATANHSYLSTGNKCNYEPKATLIVNGVLCASSTQQQIVTVWDDDDHNGGHMHISPTVYPVCYGNSANMRFQDLTQFNCVPPQEKDVPNLYTRWVQWIYGTDNTMTGTPVTINGNPVIFPLTGPVLTLPGPVTGSGVWSDFINVANDKLIGQYFQVTLRNWNYCNPYDDPAIPGPPADPVNGDHPPVVTTAIVLIVSLPDPTITPVDTLCEESDPVTLHAHDGGGTWSGDGVTGNIFDPAAAGPGDHIITYSITDHNGCSASDQVTVTVMPSPTVSISPVNSMYVTAPPVALQATPLNGTWSGPGVTGSTFDPATAGTGVHVISYQTQPDPFGCRGADTIHITVIMPPLPIAAFQPDTAAGCTPLEVTFHNWSTNAESYLWDFGDKTYSADASPQHTYYIPGTYIVSLTATNVSGQSICHGQMTVYQNPTANFNIYPTEVTSSTQIVVFTDYSYYAVSWSWNFGDATGSSEQNPWHKYEAEGVYDVSLTVRSQDGCIDSARYKSPVNVDFKSGQIHFPNAFRWNGSGPTGGYWQDNQLDDAIFRPYFTNVLSYKLQIFNRWGVLIYTSDDLHKGWDGYFNGSKLSVQGVYVWKAKGQYANGTYFDKVGDVTFLH
jgi:PKD repeat protein